MTIVSGASDGIRCNSAAKESAGAAATLGSQTAAASNEVIVPDALSANNEGNLVGTPSYVGRMIAIRPWEMKVERVSVVVAGGSTYAVNDTITLNGVAGVGGAPVLTVSAVSSGAVTAVTVTQPGAVEIRRVGMTSSPSPADNPVGQASTSGSGTGATFDIIWEPNFELRFIIADATNTLTVHEDWTDPPESGDNWAVSYIMLDYATLTGCTLRTQSGVFECSRRIKIGPSVDGTRRGWLAMIDGVQTELDNVDDPMLVENGGLWTVGYKQGGVPLNGAYLSTSGTGNPAGIDLQAPGCLFYLLDFQTRSPREPLSIDGTNAGAAADDNWDEDEGLFGRQVGREISSGKQFDAAMHRLGPTRYKDLIWQVSPETTNLNRLMTVYLGGANGDVGNVMHRLNRILVKDTSTHTATTGFFAQRSVTTSAAVFDFLRNITFAVDVAHGIVQIDANETWQFVNPVWQPNLAAQVSFEFLSTTANSIQELMSLIIRPIDTDGVGIAGVHGYIYERFNNNLPDENTNRSDSVAFDPVLEERFEDELKAGEVAYVSDVLNAVYTPISTTSVVRSSRGSFAWRGYDYGNLPVTLAFGVELKGGIDNSALFLFDEAITETTQATALTNPTTNPTVTKHGLGETDTRPMKALGYDLGTGGVAPSLGETLTQGSATGVVVDVEGDDASGTVLLETWNGTEFTDNQNITGGTSAFDATTNILGVGGFYEEYTWEVDAKGEAMTIVYDYLAARMAEATLAAGFEEVIVWGGDEVAANQLLFSGSTGWFTPRALHAHLGVLQDRSASVEDYFDNFNVADQALDATTPWEKGDAGFSSHEIVSNEMQAAIDTPDDSYTMVTEAQYNHEDDQYARITITGLPADAGSTSYFGCGVRMNTSAGGYFAVIARISGVNSWQLVKVQFSNISAGGADQVITVLGAGPSTPAVSDEIDIVVFGNRIRMLVNGVIEAEAVDDDFTTGQPGVIGMQVSATDQLQFFDDFYSGDWVNAKTDFPEGVWIHDRGAGTVAFMTADSGATFVPEVLLTITFTPLIVGSEVRAYLTGTNVEVGGVESSGTNFQLAVAAGTAIDYVVLNQNAATNIAYVPIRTENVTFTASQDLIINQQRDRNYDSGL